MRKQLQAEHGKADLEKRIAELEAKKTKQSNKVIELKSKLEAIERRNQERKEQEDKKRTTELDFLKYQEKHLQTFLKTVSESNKWANWLPSLTALKQANRRQVYSMLKPQQQLICINVSAQKIISNI